MNIAALALVGLLAAPKTAARPAALARDVARVAASGDRVESGKPSTANEAAVARASDLFALASRQGAEGRLQEAWDSFREAEQRAHSEKKKTLAVKAVRRRVEVEARLGTLYVQLPRAEAMTNLDVRIDGAPLDQRYLGAPDPARPPLVTPGKHVLLASLAGFRPFEIVIDVPARESRTVVFPALDPEEMPSPTTTPPAESLDRPERSPPPANVPTPSNKPFRVSLTSVVDAYRPGAIFGYSFPNMLTLSARAPPALELFARGGIARGESPAAGTGTVVSSPGFGLAYDIKTGQSFTITPRLLVTPLAIGMGLPGAPSDGRGSSSSSPIGSDWPVHSWRSFTSSNA